MAIVRYFFVYICKSPAFKLILPYKQTNCFIGLGYDWKYSFRSVQLYYFKCFHFLYLSYLDKLIIVIIIYTVYFMCHQPFFHATSLCVQSCPTPCLFYGSILRVFSYPHPLPFLCHQHLCLLMPPPLTFLCQQSLCLFMPPRIEK